MLFFLGVSNSCAIRIFWKRQQNVGFKRKVSVNSDGDWSSNPYIILLQKSIIAVTVSQFSRKSGINLVLSPKTTKRTLRGSLSLILLKTPIMTDMQRGTKA
jgi:type II secretory pathway component GspD/PulD (secretin)